MWGRLKDWASALKRQLAVLWLAARDPRTPLAAKLVAGATAAYALSPIDLIPDFIPVLGLLDDLLIVPFGIWLSLRLIPADLLTELSARAAEAKTGRSRAGLLFVLACWSVLAVLALRWWWAR